MKLTYLGTAAAEGFPAIFCNCEHCREARALGGKNVRTRSQAIINDELVIDLPADTYSHFLNNNIEGNKIKYLLVTHSHQDHFYHNELLMRRPPYAHNMTSPRLKVFCGSGTAAIIEKECNDEKLAIDCKQICYFETVSVGDYSVTALPARHYEGDGALFYIIKSDKTLLYAHDTGYFYDEVFEYIKTNGISFDMISLDCTYVDRPVSDSNTHMGIDNINRVVKRLADIGAVTDKTQVYINHFSHNAAPIHDKLEKRVAEYGYKVSYDGLTVQL